MLVSSSHLLLLQVTGKVMKFVLSVKWSPCVWCAVWENVLELSVKITLMVHVVLNFVAIMVTTVVNRRGIVWMFVIGS